MNRFTYIISMYRYFHVLYTNVPHRQVHRTHQKHFIYTLLTQCTCYFWGLLLWSYSHYGAVNHINVQEIVFVLSANEAKTQSPQRCRMSEKKKKKAGSALTYFVRNVWASAQLSLKALGTVLQEGAENPPRAAALTSSFFPRLHTFTFVWQWNPTFKVASCRCNMKDKWKRKKRNNLKAPQVPFFFLLLSISLS